MSKTTQDGRLPMSPTSSLSGIGLFALTVWHRSKSKLIGVLAYGHMDTPTDTPQQRSFPPEIVEMIIAHLKHDIPTLKACAATCLCWYNVAIPHLYRTLILREWTSNMFWNQRPNPLPSLFKLGVLPFVEKLNFKEAFARGCWVVPAIFDSRSVRYLRAMVNLRELKIEELDFSKFPVGFGQYLGHFAPTLRSVALSSPKGTHRQLLDFLRLFPELDDIHISCYTTRGGGCEASDAQLVPISGGLRGRLILDVFTEAELLKKMVIAFGGMRFTFVDLRVTQGIRLLLDACAGTLEVLRIRPSDAAYHPLVFLAGHDYDLSSCTALRSIEVSVDSLIEARQALSTITSPVFSEIVVVFSEDEPVYALESLDRAIYNLYQVKEFSVAFCLEALEASRVESQHKLTLETRGAVAAGLYDFLPRPPVVFSRAIADY